MKALTSLAILLMLLSACEYTALRRIDRLPAATQKGAHTFGCLVNGEVWLPKSFLGSFLTIPPRVRVYYDTATHAFSLESNRIDEKEPTNQRFWFHSDSLMIGDTIWLGHEEEVRRHGQYYHYAYFSDEQIPVSYATWGEDSLTYSGYIYCTEVRLASGDSLPGFIAGTFAFTARNADSTQYIEVTEGRFDVQLRH